MQKVRFSMADLVVATVPLAAVLARPQAADAAKISTRLYMPTMLLKDSMPAGLTDLESVPTLRATNADDDFEARLSEYVRAIRATSAVFAVANHKEKTLAQDQGNVLWINCWCIISGFGSYMQIDMTVRASCDACDACEPLECQADGRERERYMRAFRSVVSFTGSRCADGRAAARARGLGRRKEPKPRDDRVLRAWCVRACALSSICGWRMMLCCQCRVMAACCASWRPERRATDGMRGRSVGAEPMMGGVVATIGAQRRPPR